MQNVKEVMHSALRICCEEYPGPVHIDLPSDIAGLEIDESVVINAVIYPEDYKWLIVKQK